MALPNGSNGIKPSSSAQTSAKAGHVNMMDDTIIANLPASGLRAVLRGLLGTDESFIMTKNFQALSKRYLDATRPATVAALFDDNSEPTDAMAVVQGRYRSLMGCGSGLESVEVLTEVVEQTGEMLKRLRKKQIPEVLAKVDGDIVQVVTAVQKELTTTSGMREKTDAEADTLEKLRLALLECKEQADIHKQDFVFERGFARLQMFNGVSTKTSLRAISSQNHVFVTSNSPLESVQLGKAVVPRMFMGLWQFSSPAWGTTASRAKVNAHFRKHVDCAFTAFDMADHYGDAEVSFGHFRSTQPDADKIFCATKVCYFAAAEITESSVAANITERLTNISSDTVDLLQFHWQNYEDRQYVKAVRLIQDDPRVLSVGLVNFDTKHMEEILDSGIEIVTNQVQFSLIDLRPTFSMGESCKKQRVKLLTYGSLCGGFLADKWLGKPAPSPFQEDMTPSHRKYYEMIIAWGGWTLFQELLTILSEIGRKYNVTISNVAVRWILDHEYVGAVIIGARMGVSEHTEENLRSFGFRLDEEDQQLIQGVLERCRAREMFEAMGDCGAEYRQ